MSSVEGYCSWCFERTEHKLVKKSHLSRNIYQCNCCRNNTLICRYCSELARGTPNSSVLEGVEVGGLGKLAQTWNNELCAEHDGTIASFSKLGLKIKDITEYENIFERDKRNLAKVGKYAGLGVAGVVSVAGVAATAGSGAAPVAAAMGKLGLLGTASTGTAISSLSGAALTSASLAAVGGSVAAGTAIISATGLALGGVMGGVIANKYHGEDKSFAIRKLRDRDTEVKTIFINGFTQEKETDFHDWQISQLSYDSQHVMYGVNWASKTNTKLGIAFSKGVGTSAAKKILISIAEAGSRSGAKKLNPLGWLALLSDLAANPWHNSMLRAAQTGVQVADAISRTEGQKFNLVGHSLGCRVIYYALEALSSKVDKYINDVILLGGAVGRSDVDGWTKALSAVDGKLYNCHSEQDQVLSHVYRIANAGLSSPIGILPIELEHEKLTNINCDDLVESHMTWKKHYEKILQRIYG
ncbi:DUF726 domain-containing protein [Pseudoalteromonas sp. BDTF-M6]|uniref:DUF726 domain-containing protein n=1 Tax=Pseudoalteromonas sp. BDTF-M6 TaxID=2796132 RepID=UPI001BAEEFBD|nr:DUF726 domain-containing protein [Pseudoalteromonas sp. BDTF-M6]MBS3798773.1 DUF726 domain-containing protein [Pseudoalteromonas sp. BDTF-M6]